MIGITRTLIFFAILMSGGVSAQLQLVVNGQPVEGLNTTLVPGTSYAPAQGYAEALGATFTYDAVRLRLGVGWDLPLSGSWVVGNRLTYDGSSFGSLHSNGTAVQESVGLGTLRFGMYLGRR